MATEVGASMTSAAQLCVSSMDPAQKALFFARLRDDTVRFVQGATHAWGPREECRRFTVLGEYFMCVRWRDAFVAAGADVVRVVHALFRLASLGAMPRDRRRFEEGVLGDLRGLRVGKAAFLEAANSPLLRHLYRLNAARTNKRQKVFLWAEVPFFDLAQAAIAREARAEGVPRTGPYAPLCRSARPSPPSLSASLTPPPAVSPAQSVARDADALCALASSQPALRSCGSAADAMESLALAAEAEMGLVSRVPARPRPSTISHLLCD